MALTFTQRLRLSLGGKAFRAYEITHDGSETSIDASDLEMNYVEAAMIGAGTVPLSATSTTYADLTTAQGSALAMTALSSGAVSLLWAIGY
jgi:hypothetical protein